MNNSIVLIQRGISANTHPVSGKSGKLYGQAVYSGQHQGVIFKMSIDQYRQFMNDIIGNTLPGQQWMPEIVSEEQAAALPESQAVAAPVRKEEKPDVQPTVQDPDADIAPIHAAAPVIGTEREHPDPAKPIAPAPPKPAPQESQPPPPAPPAKPQPFGPGTGPEEAIGGRTPVGSNEPTPKPDRKPLPPAVAIVVDAVAERIRPSLQLIYERLDAIAHMRNGAKKTRKRNPELAALQKQARVLGINSFGKSAETLKAEIEGVNPL